MTKETAAWLIVRGTGVYFLVHALLTGFNAVSQASFRFVLGSLASPAMEVEAATAEAWAVTNATEAVVTFVVALYLLRRGSAVHKLLLKGAT